MANFNYLICAAVCDLCGLIGTLPVMSDSEKLVVDAREGPRPRQNYGAVSSSSAENDPSSQSSESHHSPEELSEDSESRRVKSPSLHPTTTFDDSTLLKTEDTNARNTTYVTLTALTLNWLKLFM